MTKMCPFQYGKKCNYKCPLFKDGCAVVSIAETLKRLIENKTYL